MDPYRKTLATLLARTRRAVSIEAGTSSLQASALVFAPHPDDEVLGCGGTIASKLEAGAIVGIVFMTDGAASHPGRIDPHHLATIRRSEALEATAILGVPPERVHFLDFPDHSLDAHRAEAVPLVQQLLESYSPQEVYVPHREDRLEDHAATFRIVHQALDDCTRRLRVLEYPIWLWNTWPWTAGRPASGDGQARRLVTAVMDAWRLTVGCRLLVDVHSHLETKRAALGEYRSQMERRGGDPGWPILEDVSAGDFLGCFLGSHESFRLSEHSG